MNTYPLDLAETTSYTRVRTLIVDDSPFMLKILAQTLKEAGSFDLVGSATDGYQALRYVSALSPELLLMDIHMPGLNGIQATRYIKQSEHPPVIILISSDTDSMTRSLAEQAGADGFLSKEGNLQQRLIDALEDLFGPSGASRAAAADKSFQNLPAKQTKQHHGQ